MPNWCLNNLTISGKEQELIDLDEKLKENNYKLFETFIPLPKELKETEYPNNNPIQLTAHLEKQFGATNWYVWQVNNWGCKWDVELNPGGFSKNKKKLYYQFDSPWSPPKEGIRKLSEILPTLKFKLKYDEPGMCFKGTIEYKNRNEKILKDVVY